MTSFTPPTVAPDGINYARDGEAEGTLSSRLRFALFRVLCGILVTPLIGAQA